MYLRRLSLLMVIITMLSLLPQLAIPAQAAYENTYKNTGNQRADIIGVALTQVGYREGDGKSNNNKTKYGAYFDRDGTAWCGWFVSWCARQAGIPKSVLKTSGPAKPSTFGITNVKKSGYTPKAGDLFFKKNYGHVGIVYYTSGNHFYTIEGNTWSGSPRKDGVYIRKRLISDFYFGIPNYSGESGGGATSCSHSYTTKNESAHPHKEYKICSKCSNKTYTGKTKTVSGCKSCTQASCSHNYGEWKKSSSTKHERKCSLCGKTESANHKWSTAKVDKAATCNAAGSKKQTCSGCGAEKTTTIPATGKHTYGEIEYINDTYHGQKCTGCGKTEKVKHKVDKDWTFDGKNHWKFCTDCSERYEFSTHNYKDGCGSNCKSCGYLSPFDHEFEDGYGSDSKNHWSICGLCDVKVDPQPHIYTSDCDETCDVCGLIRETKTEHTNVVRSDADNHWMSCTLCGQEQDITPHSPNTRAADWEDCTCLECNYLLRSKDEHIHSFNSIDYNRRAHWGTCACGELIPEEGHRFSMESGMCSICGAKSSPLGAQKEYDWVWMLALGFSGVTIGGMSLILTIRRLFRKRVY